ncbi:hypothetical protein AEYBE204_04450 [Asticcacaulis sp. YBE204]|nr:hypothetical protein AEYBE204_04450 [Asticcacaulis sp. YBE204]
MLLSATVALGSAFAVAAREETVKADPAGQCLASKAGRALDIRDSKVAGDDTLAVRDADNRTALIRVSGCNLRKNDSFRLEQMNGRNPVCSGDDIRVIVARKPDGDNMFCEVESFTPISKDEARSYFRS